MEKAWSWTQFEPINVDNHQRTSYALHTDERIVTTFNRVHFQIQAFRSLVRMLVYMYLVVVALLVPHADSAKCVAPDEYEITMKMYFENVYYNISICSQSHMMAYTKYSIDQNNKMIVSGRTVKDYNLMLQFDIPTNGKCIIRTIQQDRTREIPDSAVKVDHFPIPLPSTVPQGIEYWCYDFDGRNEIITGVLRIQPNVCGLMARGILNNNHQLMPESVAYIIGNYSLIISNKKVFEVPLNCLEDYRKST